MHCAFDDAFLNKCEKANSDDSRYDQALPRERIFSEIIHQRNGRNGQQIQKVNAN